MVLCDVCFGGTWGSLNVTDGGCQIYNWAGTSFQYSVAGQSNIDAASGTVLSGCTTDYDGGSWGVHDYTQLVGVYRSSTPTRYNGFAGWFVSTDYTLDGSVSSSWQIRTIIDYYGPSCSDVSGSGTTTESIIGSASSLSSGKIYVGGFINADGAYYTWVRFRFKIIKSSDSSVYEYSDWTPWVGANGLVYPTSTPANTATPTNTPIPVPPTNTPTPTWTPTPTNTPVPPTPIPTNTNTATPTPTPKPTLAPIGKVSVSEAPSTNGRVHVYVYDTDLVSWYSIVQDVNGDSTNDFSYFLIEYCPKNPVISSIPPDSDFDVWGTQTNYAFILSGFGEGDWWIKVTPYDSTTVNPGTPGYTYFSVQFPTPTPLPTSTPTNTVPTSTPTPTNTVPTNTPTDTATWTPTETPTPTNTVPTSTPTMTPTGTVLPTLIPTNTNTPTFTAVPTPTSTNTTTPTYTTPPTAVPTSTNTPVPPTPTNTPTHTIPPTPTYTAIPTEVPTPTGTQAQTPTPLPLDFLHVKYPDGSVYWFGGEIIGIKP